LTSARAKFHWSFSFLAHHTSISSHEWLLAAHFPTFYGRVQPLFDVRLGKFLKMKIENIFLLFFLIRSSGGGWKSFRWGRETQEEALKLLNSSTWKTWCVVKEWKTFGESSARFSTPAKWGFNVAAPATSLRIFFCQFSLLFVYEISQPAPAEHP
jgi:hypothetical protein